MVGAGCGRFLVDAPVIAHHHIVQNEFEITLLAPEIACNARPGQFVMVIYGEGYTTEARRPFSLYNADPANGTISILYLARGSFTSEMARKKPGDIVRLTGPLGNGFQWNRNVAEHSVLVAGGIGAPPICFLAKQMCSDIYAGLKPYRITVINGARTAEMLIGLAGLVELGVNLFTVTDDGSAGIMGTVSDVLAEQIKMYEAPEDRSNLQVYACGPMRMLRSITDVCLTGQVRGQISIETPMPCGIGDCDGCQVTVRDKHSPEFEIKVRSCIDGPIFDVDAYVWPSE